MPWWVWVFLFACLFGLIVFRKSLVGLAVSPLEGGVNYLSQCLKEHGYEPGTVPRVALRKLVQG